LLIEGIEINAISVKSPTARSSVTMMDVDVVDATEGGHLNENDHTKNDYVDPKELYHLNDLNQLDGSPEEKSEVSEASEASSPAAPRRVWRPTGCCYDDRMKLHANAEFSMSKAHPEDPRRIEAIMNELKEAGLIYKGSDTDLEEILKESPTRWMYRIAARSATMPEICTVHLATHYHWVESLSQKSPEDLREITATFDMGRKSLYVGNLTYEASLISAGGAIETCKNVVAGNVKNAIAIIRPPGHHAEHNESLGFCISGWPILPWTTR
jgi:histone deacetylase 6